MTIIRDFKAFLLRGNVVDLAVGIAMGAAFVAVVNSLVADLITPIIAALTGNTNFSSLTFSVNGSQFRYGSFINAIVSFLTVATAIFFFVVTPYNHFQSRMRKEPPPDPTTRKCPECMSEISIEAKRCAFCTAQVAPA
ncbi:MAG: large conductance mechanosensitive channel protein MscL [Chloroflexota bacterium]